MALTRMSDVIRRHPLCIAAIISCHGRWPPIVHYSTIMHIAAEFPLETTVALPSDPSASEPLFR